MHTLWITTFTNIYKHELPSLPQLFGFWSSPHGTTTPGASWQPGMGRERTRSIVGTAPAMVISTGPLFPHVVNWHVPGSNFLPACSAVTYVKSRARVALCPHTRSNVFHHRIHRTRGTTTGASNA
ncbi:MAG: hypothetical protein E6I80_20995 [Chloroflexi bacterium]|nr:MAG: hypothetical protein E6I80_20995 [Chloroflexota bacterium]